MGAAGPGSFDCSGLTMDALAQAGITVPHNANAQWHQTRAHPVAGDQLAPGDLVFYAGADGSVASPGHIRIYAGNGEIIDAPYAGADVRFDPLTSIRGYAGATDRVPHARTIETNSAMRVSRHQAWIVEFSMNYPDGASQGLTWSNELGAVVVVDRGATQAPAVFYVSVPGNLGTVHVATLVSSLSLSSQT
jgi:cell wall-associated NlpC family hydrolase